VVVVTADTCNNNIGMWVKWNPEVLKNNKIEELSTPLAIKKILRPL